MLREMSWKQFILWQQFDVIEPIGGRRIDWNAASIASVLMNLASAFAKSKKRVSVKDMLLEFKEDEPEAPQAPARQTWQEQKFIAMMWAATADVPEEKPASRKRRRSNGPRP